MAWVFTFRLFWGILPLSLLLRVADFAVIRDPVARARSVILHGRGKAYLKAHPNSFCNEFRTNEAAVRGCWELRRNFIYIYLAPCAALTFEFCGQGNRKECTWCGAPSTGECMARSHASDPCVVAVSTTGPSLPSGRGNTPTAAGLPLPEPRCECVGGGVTARCSNAEIVTCIGERYAMLLPLELINEARALLVLDHGFTVPDVMCTERSQHNGRAPGHSALASAESRVPLPDVKAFFTATERQELLDNNPVDMLLHRYAVGAIEARIKAHGDRFNQTLTLVAGFVGKAEHECNLTKEHNWGFAGKLRKFEAQYQCFKDLYANSSGYEK